LISSGNNEIYLNETKFSMIIYFSIHAKIAYKVYNKMMKKINGIFLYIFGIFFKITKTVIT